jgi:hypothetical protein
MVDDVPARGVAVRDLRVKGERMMTPGHRRLLSMEDPGGETWPERAR